MCNDRHCQVIHHDVYPIVERTPAKPNIRWGGFCNKKASICPFSVPPRACKHRSRDADDPMNFFFGNSYIYKILFTLTMFGNINRFMFKIF